MLSRRIRETRWLLLLRERIQLLEEREVLAERALDTRRVRPLAVVGAVGEAHDLVVVDHFLLAPHGALPEMPKYFSFSI